MPFKRLPLALALGILPLWSAPASALGIGDVVNQPRMGERLHIEVRLISSSGERIDPTCVQLAPGDASDDLPWVRGAHVRVENGVHPKAVIESSEIVNNPIYLLGLKAVCEGVVAREFTLMPQAPLELSERPSTGGTASNPAAPPKTQPTAGPAQAPGAWETSEGDTLEGIAQALYPDDAKARKRFVAAAIKANPGLFENAANPEQLGLPAGKILNTAPGKPSRPARADSAANKLAAAPKQAKDQARQGRGETGNARSVPRDGESMRPNLADRLLVGESGEGEASLRFATQLDDSRSRGLSEAQREQLRQEQRLVAELDEKIVASLALAEKIRNMEGYLEKLQSDMVQLDQKIQNAKNGKAQPAESVETVKPVVPGPQPAAQPKREAADDLNWPMYAAGAASVLLLGGWVWQRRRRTQFLYEEASGEPEDPALDEPQVSDQTDGEQTSDEVIELDKPLDLPLSEFPLDENAHVGVAEHDSALELAEIMLSFGRVQGAAQTLADYIESSPRQSLKPWLKLLGIYRDAGMQTEFSELAARMHQNFNVKLIGWDDLEGPATQSSLEEVRHLIEPIKANWGTSACLSYLRHLLLDNRDGSRGGFALGVADDITLLVSVLETQLFQQPAHA